MSRERYLRLSPKQNAFVSALLKGASYAVAYRKAGFLGGPAVTDAVATSNASRLISTNENVREAIEAGKREVRELAKLDAADLVAMLLNVRRIAEEADPPQASAAVAAIMGIGKLLGIAIDRSEAHIMHHKPAPLPTTLVELSTADWQAQFDPQKAIEPVSVDDFFD